MSQATASRRTRQRASAPPEPPEVPVETERTEVVDRLDVRHLFETIWKWRLLISIGVVFTLAAALAILRLAQPPYTAEQTLLFDQPGIIAGAEGQSVSEKLNNLLPTYAVVAESDRTMERVRRDIGTSATINDLRERVTVTQVPSTLTLRFESKDASATAAVTLTEATVDAFADELDAIQDRAAVPDSLRYVVTPLSEVTAERPPRRELRTLALAAFLAFAVMVGLAFTLEYVERS